MMSAQGVRKSFHSTEVLKGIDMEVRRGEVRCIMGPSGSGKSTFLRCINNLETINSGRITVDGERVGVRRLRGKLFPLGSKESAKQRSQIGMVFQHFNLFPHMTALGNVIEGPLTVKNAPKGATLERGKALLDRVGLGDKYHSYPSQLSGGQQQRVAIARMLAMEPKLLLFDEPTSALDPELVGEVLDVIRDLANDGLTMIIVTHEIGFAREAADTVAFMDEGNVIEVGSPQQVLVSPQHERTAKFISQVL